MPKSSFRVLAEMALPQRKCRISSWPLIALLALAPLAGAAPAGASPNQSGPSLGGPIQKALRRSAEQALAAYAEAHDWKDMEAQYDVWLPEGAKRLPACPKPLDVQAAQEQKLPWGRLSYQVSCPGANSWSVRGRVEVKLWLTLWTARGDLPQKHELTEADMVGRRIEVTRLRDFTVNQEEILGQRTQRRIRAGQPLLASALLPPLAVRKGEQVVIQAEKDGIVASIKGEALENGSEGEAIKVRNLSSGVEIQAWVDGPGVVKTRF